MQFGFPFIDVLVLPTDAGPGNLRLIIDGTTGQIQIYDSNDFLVGVLGPDDPNDRAILQISDPGGSYTRITANSGLTGIALNPPDTVGHTITRTATVIGDIDTGVGNRPILVLEAPQIDNLDFARIFLNSEDTVVHRRPSFVFDSNDNNTPILIFAAMPDGAGAASDREIGLGVPPGGWQQFGGNSGVKAAGVAFDHSLTIGVLANQLYEFRLEANIQSAVAGQGSIQIRRDGVVIGEMMSYPYTAVNQFYNCGGLNFTYLAPADDTSTTFDLINNPASGTGLNLIATPTRQFFVKHIGSD